MSKVDTKEWKEFKVGDFFEFHLSNDDIQPKNIEIGKVPLVSAGKENNGIVSYISDNNAKLWDKNTITVDMFGKTFYQPNPYFAVSHGRVNILIPKFEISEYVCRFFVSLIEKVAFDKYEFKEMCTGKKLSKDIIKLPVDNEGNPDREYMENYMKNLEDKCKTKLQNLILARGVVRLINTDLWKEFKVGDLFEILENKTKLANKDLCDEGKIPVYSSSVDNNGIFGYTSQNPDYVTNEECPFFIIFGDHTKSMHIANGSFCIMDNVKVLKPYIYNTNITRFILTVWKASIPDLGYSRHRNVAKQSNFLLPIDHEGNPNRAYMESYMKNLMEKNQKKLQSLH